VKAIQFIGRIMSAKTWALCALPIAIGACASIGSANAKDESSSLQMGALTRTYTVHVPQTPPPSGGFPVILAFHGGGMQGAGMRRLTQLDALADRDGFIVIYPDGIDKHWNDGRSTIKNPQDDVGFISKLLGTLSQDHAVNSRRIYATGISNGALFAERLGCELSPQIAGIAPVAGTLPAETAPGCRPSRPVAVMQIDGTADPIMPYGGGAVKDFGGRGEGGNVLSVMQTAEQWARLNRCEIRAEARPLPVTARFDRTRAFSTQYLNCAPGGQVRILTVEGGGHAWPGGPQYAPRLMIGVSSRQFNASNMIAEFFLSLPG